MCVWINLVLVSQIIWLIYLSLYINNHLLPSHQIDHRRLLISWQVPSVTYLSYCLIHLFTSWHCSHKMHSIVGDSRTAIWFVILVWFCHRCQNPILYRHWIVYSYVWNLSSFIICLDIINLTVLSSEGFARLLGLDYLWIERISILDLSQGQRILCELWVIIWQIYVQQDSFSSTI